jgi:AcrR family transcriptional regulator
MTRKRRPGERPVPAPREIPLDNEKIEAWGRGLARAPLDAAAILTSQYRVSATSETRIQQIMRAAETLFENRRFHEITLDEVAAVAHVGKGTIYRYFADKDDLFFRTATSGFDALCERLETRVPEDSGFEQRLLAACTQVTQFFAERRRLFRLMDAEQGRADHADKPQLGELWQAKRQRMVAAVATILKQGMKDGRVRQRPPAEIMATYLLGMLRTRARDLGLASEEHRGLEPLIALFLNGAGEPTARDALSHG